MPSSNDTAFTYTHTLLPRPRRRHAACARASSSASASSDKALLSSPSHLLSALLKDVPPLVLDVRGTVGKPRGRIPPTGGYQSVTYLADRDAYQDSHVRTARFVDWRRLRAGCPTLADAAKGAEGNVYIYDWGDMLFATRAWFVLRCAGVRAHVVNGGWRAWMRMGGMVELGGGSEIEIVDRESGKKERNCISLREMKEIVQMKDKAEVILVDARSARQFSGVERRARRAGRIPGAVNVPFRRMLREDGGGMLETEQLRAVLTECGVLRGDDGTRFVAYCNGGVASTLVIFALIRCGVRFDRACNYCGSFNEWGNVTDTKVVSDA